MELAGISPKRPVTLKNLDNISLKSALNIMLNGTDLTWVIRDEVLQITTKAQRPCQAGDQGLRGGGAGSSRGK